MKQRISEEKCAKAGFRDGSDSRKLDVGRQLRPLGHADVVGCRRHSGQRHLPHGCQGLHRLESDVPRLYTHPHILDGLRNDRQGP